ncbi:MAG TPA: Uma2 family endonuclease [Bryobacteraceae bacterium]|nr:Uma2 family endonuclease [Bryobacteraceae bacterium]
MGTKTLVSVEEFDRLEEPDELSYELDEGELVVMTKPRPLHNRVVANLDFELRTYLKTHPVGEVFNPDNLFVLGPNIKRAPDVSFLRAERAKQIDADADIPGAPDLAIEVLSPSDTASAMRRKIRQYFSAGAQCVWVVYPETREVEVWREASRPQIVLQETDLLEAPDLLTGFSLSVGALFG